VSVVLCLTVSGGSLSSWAFSSMGDEFQAVRFLEKKRTNSGPFMESTSKHSIYTRAAHGWLSTNATTEGGSGDRRTPACR
jgi:hypothetical protein